jgi:phage N-6-adenine-methyltransferase
VTYRELGHATGNVEWETPADLFADLAREFAGGCFDLDVCATPENAKCDRYFTEADNGLLQPWSGRCWMNPPYGREIRLWMAKARQEGERGVLVVTLPPLRPDAGWWRDSTAAAALVRILPGRLRFGGHEDAAPVGNAVMVFGPLTGRHGTEPRRCAHCRRWWFPARGDAVTCSERCKKALQRSRITGTKRDRRRVA